MRSFRAALWSLVLLALIGTAFLIWSNMDRDRLTEVRYLGEADIRSEFTLTDHTGRQVTQADYSDRWQIVFFGFTNCPDVCPTTLAYLASVLDLLGDDADKVAPIFITVDPKRDTVPVMANYVSAFHPRLIGLTGTEQQVAEAVRNFRTWYEPTTEASAPDGYLMAHGGYIYLMRPGGAFDAVFQEGAQLPEALAQEIRRKL